MSQLIDKLNQVSKAVLQPMGFRAAKSGSAKPKMLLIASIAPAENVDSLADYVTGANAVLLPITKSSSGAKNLQKLVQSLPDIPWGGWLRDIDEKGIGKLVKVGCDFVVFPATGKVLDIPQDDKVGKILQVESSLNEGLLKTVNELPVAAILTAAEPEGEYSLSWHHLMLFQRLANLLSKPLLASIPLKTTASELKSLWEAGVDGVVVEVGKGQPIEKLRELRQAIDDLIPLPPRRWGKTGAVLPHFGEAVDTASDIEEEEEE
ncbi:hypothetical protein ACFLUZ_03090 [Chloroflexota bacterium]